MDSVPARAMPGPSRRSGSRPHSDGMRVRAAARSPASSSRASAAPCPASEAPPSTVQVAAAVSAVRATGCRTRSASETEPDRAPDQHRDVPGAGGPAVGVRAPLQRCGGGPEPGDGMEPARIAERDVGQVPEQQPP